MPYPTVPIVATGEALDPDKLEAALAWLKAAVSGIPLLSRSSTSPWTMEDTTLGARIKYTGATDVVWTIPLDLNPDTSVAMPIRILQIGTGKVTLDVSSWTTVNKPPALDPVRSAGPGGMLYALVGPAGSGEIDLDATA